MNDFKDSYKKPEVNQSNGCPGSRAQQFDVPENPDPKSFNVSQLAQWPVQLTLVPPQAPYFNNADLLIVADCVPFAHGDFHNKFLQGKPLVVGCPKLDNLQSYVDKLTEIFASNNIKSAEVLLMEVPCCGGIAQAAQIAKNQSGKEFSLKVTTIGVRGEELGSREI